MTRGAKGRGLRGVVRHLIRRCRAFLRTIPLLLFSPAQPEDLDTNQEDHVADEWRYLCMTRPIAPVRPPERKDRVFVNDPLDMMKKKGRG